MWRKPMLLIAFVSSWGVCRAAIAANPVSQIIDEEIAAALRADNIAAAPRADDGELLRRIYLDVLGRIPTADEACSFLNDKSPHKHHRLIDDLLAHEEMAFYWSTVLDEWFNGSLPERGATNDGFLTYLQLAIKANKPWNTIAREMLDPDPADEQQRQASYFLAVRLQGGDNAAKTDAMTSGVSTVFFGVQLQCAMCHDHPFVDEWKQDNYYGLAAFLGRTQTAKMDNATVLKERADGEVTFITTSQEERRAKLLFLDGRVFDEPVPPEDRDRWYTKGKNGLPDEPYFSRRALLADYALTADSPLFKRAIVNRIWKQLMGRGLVEPVDQMHKANAASHPALLDRLADDFAADGFNLRRLMAGVLHSDAYLRSSRWLGIGQRPSDQQYATAILKPLTPDQLAVSVGLATGHYEMMQAKLEREKDKRKIDKITPSIVRAFYSRENEVREFASRFRDGGDTFEANASQALFLSYNGSMQKRLQPSGGNLVERLSKESDHAKAASEAFLTVLARQPEPDELDRAVKFLDASDPPQPQLCSELVWALLCSGEFRFNH
ncbi:MAG: DUF1549 domain-containing protein [Planctomycetales bacterium]|nr:DUF1549 domain-containing protein [Planctomycetales bacterium]